MRRPLHLIAALSTAAHHVFELGAGVGLVFQPYLGLSGALSFWGTGLPGWALLAARGSSRADPVLAVAAGTGMAGAAIHFSLWPWRLRGPLPWLTGAEGLRPGQMPAYNLVLYVWAGACLTALLVETPGKSRLWALAGLAAGVPLRSSARHHFDWLREVAESEPAWWNRAGRHALGPA